MKRKFRITVGDLTYNDEHGFFYGRVNGKKVTVNQISDKDGKVKWLVNEELEVWEMKDDKKNEASNF